MNLLKYLFAGTLFGIILTKAEVISWFRIYEMFHFQAFHMYGVIGSAVVTALISLQLIRKMKLKSIEGEEIHIPEKPFQKGQAFGGLLFGMGWALTGACPGPLFALLGNGYWLILSGILAALAGTWLYGFLREKLPH